ncbi:cache domain-containing protein [Microbacterium sp. BWT-B31]|uniref:PDC sensor domain-containing protein n=1 Tax=Microbacterium sp. BWT-B31 TaxID=3232072 RepID=UPI003528905F
MTAATNRSQVEVAAHVAATIDGIFAMIDSWKALLEARLATLDAPSAASLDPVVEGFAVEAVNGDTLLTGAGFVAAPDALSDAAWHLAWWLSGSGSARDVRRLATIDDPSHEQFRDYTALEWWRVPAATGARHLTGPYVDYVCTDDYTVTITAPVVARGRLLGLVGADALVDRLERELLRVLRSGAMPATVVNASCRVVTSTDARREPGSILRVEGLAEAVRTGGTVPLVLRDGASVLACGDTSLALVVGI